MRFQDASNTQKILPRHVGIIMDGNGRWAQKKGQPRSFGHKAGVTSLKRIVRHAGEIGIEYLSLFAFSSENWRRPQDEIGELMRLLRWYLRSEAADLHKNNVRLKVIGDRSRFDHDIVDMIGRVEELTADNAGLTLIIALNYGGRWDIAQAARRLALDILKDPDHLPDRPDMEDKLEGYLSTATLPDLDLVIRTSGEQRISNFLIWQAAYAEFVFTDTLWPDFDKDDFDSALDLYAKRNRRFGGVIAQSE